MCQLPLPAILYLLKSYTQHSKGLDLISAKCTICSQLSAAGYKKTNDLKSDSSNRLEVVIFNLPEINFFYSSLISNINKCNFHFFIFCRLKQLGIRLSNNESCKGRRSDQSPLFLVLPGTSFDKKGYRILERACLFSTESSGPLHQMHITRTPS